MLCTIPFIHTSEVSPLQYEKIKPLRLSPNCNIPDLITKRGRHNLHLTRTFNREMKKQKWTVGHDVIAPVAGYVINGSAQSVDSLLDKLVDKGVLTVKEANDLREESDKDFTKAYAAKSGMSEWVSALK